MYAMSSVPSCYVAENIDKISFSHLFLTKSKTSCSQALFLQLEPSGHPDGHPLDSAKFVDVFPVLGRPKLDTVS